MYKTAVYTLVHLSTATCSDRHIVKGDITLAPSHHTSCQRAVEQYHLTLCSECWSISRQVI